MPILHAWTLLLLLVVAFAPGCTKREAARDEVISVDQSDAEMNAAIARAREGLAAFWEVFTQRKSGETNFALKVRITDGDDVEHFWANEIERQDGKIFATINNDPNLVKTVKLGQRIEIPEADISDWLYTRGGKMVGNYTLRPLFKQMPSAEVEWYRQMLAEP